MSGDPPTTSAHSLRYLPVLGGAAVLALVVLVLNLERLLVLDDQVWRAVLLLRGCDTDVIVESAVEVATNALTVVLVVATVLHVRLHGIPSAWPWMTATALGLLASRTLKHLLTRERPSSLPDVALGYSFPSAHVMNSLVALLAVIALSHGFRRRKLWLVAAASPVLVVTAGRLLLGRHWALDVVGGVLAAVGFVGLTVPLVDRHPRLGPLALGVSLMAVFALDNWMGTAGFRLPAPLVSGRFALSDVDVGSELRSRLGGDWREAALEHPAGSLVWLEGSGTISIDVPQALIDLASESTTPAGAGLRLALSGRPATPLTRCATMSVALNGRPLGRFVPFVGWREYRLPIPPSVMRTGSNELAIEARTAEGPWRFAVDRVRLAQELSDQ